ncbi:MAG: zinc-binding dehydrogenase [Candidatus Hydrogenedens sp.]|nr:zinc-binding dehydrogenase [Candidatus Hydrogenedens sp.]
MKQVLVKRGQVRVEEVPPPSAAAGMALVRVSHSLISSGTESGFVSDGGTAGFVLKKARDPLNVEKVKRKLASVGIKGTLEIIQNKLFQFQAPGYSTAGVIVECGASVPGFCAGDRVACAGVGFASHAEYNAVPHNLLTPVPDGVELDEAAFVALGAIAMQGVRQAQLTLGETVVVSGLGLVGQLAAQIARASGCRVIGCDPVPEKRALAESLGIEAVCDPGELDDTVQAWTAGYGADAVLICAASKGSEVTAQALEVCRRKGRVVVVGAVGLQLPREPMYLKEIDFRLSCSYGPGRYDTGYEERGVDYPYGYVRWTEGRNMAEFLRLIADGKVRVRPLVSMTKPVDEAAEAYAAVTEGRAELIAALLSYGDPAAHAQPPKRTLAIRTQAPKGDVGVAVLGAGGFANAYHLPNLKAHAKARIEAVVARTGGSAKQAAEKFGARYCATDYREVLDDPAIDAVIIATRHHLHAEMALAALDAGKHVFVEKPLALTVADCEAIVQRAEAAGKLVTVGFNRRFSKLAEIVEETLRKHPGAATIHYRCNAGALPTGHWAQDPVEGGGRILGEAVHFIDLCRWWHGAEAASVSAERLGAGGAAIADDNLAIAMRMGNGALANIVYTTTGHTALGKERVEIFAGGGVLVIDDWRALEAHGLQVKQVPRGREDKGQAALMANFIDAIAGQAELRITAEDGLRATQLAIEALQAAAR